MLSVKNTTIMKPGNDGIIVNRYSHESKIEVECPREFEWMKKMPKLIECHIISIDHVVFPNNDKIIYMIECSDGEHEYSGWIFPSMRWYEHFSSYVNCPLCDDRALAIHQWLNDRTTKHVFHKDLYDVRTILGDVTAFIETFDGEILNYGESGQAVRNVTSFDVKVVPENDTIEQAHLKCLEKLKKLKSNQDYEQVHISADNAICELLVTLGYKDVVEAYSEVDMKIESFTKAAPVLAKTKENKF